MGKDCPFMVCSKLKFSFYFISCVILIFDISKFRIMIFIPKEFIPKSSRSVYITTYHPSAFIAAISAFFYLTKL
ncbi:hypothetical protein MtrunA17_Chr6g0487651 [Medicago truncatula]|uniref:Transmembrane protein n=1 Tax=Medicago truncatula TaxID=3880 RepID=A0A396HIE3_MEDTR|nr:hypothetical protein MtrunA17_Chr6g0487651 [Medicago truncatula]